MQMKLFSSYKPYSVALIPSELIVIGLLLNDRFVPLSFTTLYKAAG